MIDGVLSLLGGELLTIIGDELVVYRTWRHRHRILIAPSLHQSISIPADTRIIYEGDVHESFCRFGDEAITATLLVDSGKVEVTRTASATLRSDINPMTRH